MKRASALLSTALLVVLPAGCGGGSSKSASTTPPATNPPIVVVDMRGKKAVEVKAGDNFFSPNGIRVDPGTIVAWKNSGSVVHNVQPPSDLADFGGAKRFGVQPPGWQEAAGVFGDDTPRSVADIDSAETLARVREWKQARKKEGKTKSD